MPHSVMLRIAGNAVLVHRVLIARRELQLDPKSGVGFGRFPGRPKNRYPVGNRLTGGDFLGGDLSGAYQLCPEEVVVFDLELEVKHAVCQWDDEVFIPLRVLGVLNNMRTGDGGLRDANGDVRIAGDNPAVLVNPAVTTITMGIGVVGGTFESVAGSEATAEMLGDEVHVRQVTSFMNGEVKVAMEPNELLRSRIGHGSQN